MLSRKDLLRTAFDEAVRVVSISWTEEKVALPIDRNVYERMLRTKAGESLDTKVQDVL